MGDLRGCCGETSLSKDHVESGGLLPVSQQYDRSCDEFTLTKSKTWSYELVLWPLAACVLISLAYLQQPSTPNAWVSLPGLSQTHPKDSHSRLRDPDALRPMLKLHSEDHIYRKPTTRHLEWAVTSNFLRPDGVLKRVYCINGEDLLSYHRGTVLLMII